MKNTLHFLKNVYLQFNLFSNKKMYLQFLNDQATDTSLNLKDLPGK